MIKLILIMLFPFLVFTMYLAIDIDNYEDEFVNYLYEVSKKHEKWIGVSCKRNDFRMQGCQFHLSTYLDPKKELHIEAKRKKFTSKKDCINYYKKKGSYNFSCGKGCSYDFHRPDFTREGYTTFTCKEIYNNFMNPNKLWYGIGCLTPDKVCKIDVHCMYGDDTCTPKVVRREFETLKKCKKFFNDRKNKEYQCLKNCGNRIETYDKPNVSCIRGGPVYKCDARYYSPAFYQK